MPFVTLRPSEADHVLHDAVLDICTFELGDDAFRFEGYVEDAWGRRSGRFRIRGKIREVTRFWLEDEANIGDFYVDGVTREAGITRFTSPLPAVLQVESTSPAIEISRDPEPFSIRHWWRWRAFASAATDA